MEYNQNFSTFDIGQHHVSLTRIEKEYESSGEMLERFIHTFSSPTDSEGNGVGNYVDLGSIQKELPNETT